MTGVQTCALSDLAGLFDVAKPVQEGEDNRSFAEKSLGDAKAILKAAFTQEALNIIGAKSPPLFDLIKSIIKLPEIIYGDAASDEVREKINTNWDLVTAPPHPTELPDAKQLGSLKQACELVVTAYRYNMIEYANNLYDALARNVQTAFLSITSGGGAPNAYDAEDTKATQRSEDTRLNSSHRSLSRMPSSA